MPRLVTSSAISRCVQWVMGRPDWLGASQAMATMAQTCSAGGNKVRDRSRHGNDYTTGPITPGCTRLSDVYRSRRCFKKSGPSRGVGILGLLTGPRTAHRTEVRSMDQLIPSLATLGEPFRDCFHPQVFATFQALLAG